MYRGEVITCANVVTDSRWDPIWTKCISTMAFRRPSRLPFSPPTAWRWALSYCLSQEAQEPDAWNQATIRLSVELARLAVERMRALDDLRS